MKHPGDLKGNPLERDVLRGKRERERRKGKENQARSHKNDIQKKIVFISHVHKKGKEKSQKELKQ